MSNMAAKNTILAGLHYSFFSNAFSREHLSVARGIKFYKNGNCKSQGSSVILRRNIHRLEKGLIMRPRREQFALDYIMETVKEYSGLFEICRKTDNISSELFWAHDVLEEYFYNVTNNQVIDEARKLFHSLPGLKTENIAKPFKRGPERGLTVSYDQLLDLSKQRRSVRWYKQKKIPREIIEKALGIALNSPSACNRQPFKYLIFDDQELVKKIASIPMGTKGFYDNFPGIIVLVGKLSYYFDERDRHIIYIDSSLSAMAFMFALETLGVSSCVINWPDIPDRENQIRKTLKLRQDESVIMLISYGYPDPEGMIPYSQKKSLDQIRTYNECINNI